MGKEARQLRPPFTGANDVTRKWRPNFFDRRRAAPSGGTTEARRDSARRAAYPSPTAFPNTLNPTNATMSRREWATTSGMTLFVRV